MFEACLKHSSLEMYYYHRGTNAICAGRSEALCVSADFCQQGQHSGPVQGNRIPATPDPNIFDEVTPVPDNLGKSNHESGERLQRTSFLIKPAPIDTDERQEEGFKLGSGEEEQINVS